ncbi:hypothetical protein PAI11_01760 [Patulibacter medicamentivorans]|uniref:Uncharacterized protein n=1 Tax=Patulibacter medicamentivorans TaxID=1097667 RepID=H0E068_9ACTN|nr:hypothetical protein [Patulibacter medicamentivorans]EHN12871.1 hypothetical protein PAI11_01760 [Patulibacter medicamentivorans]
MAAWYETVVGTRATLDGERLGGAGPIVLTVGEPSPTRRSIDFRYASIDDLLANYLRLQLFEISPVEAALIGDQTEIRYRDPDGNGVALGYVHDCWRPAGTSAPVGEHAFDPRIVLDARKTGASVSEITSMLRRAVAAEPTGPAES